MPLDVRLVNMPFWQLSMPSLSLTQLKSRAEDCLGDEVEVQLEYVNLDFGERLGPGLYERIAHDAALMHSSFGDWIFRGVAFPDMTDNTSDYAKRYGRMVGDELLQQCATGLLSRPQLTRALDEIISSRGLDKADVVGFTSTFVQTVPSLAMATRLRARNPRQILVMGGSNCEGVMGNALSTVIEGFDFLFSGPGLISFPDFLRNVLAGRAAESSKIPGVITCSASRFWGAGQTAPEPDRINFGHELDIRTPISLDYDGYLQHYATLPEPKPEPSLPFETSRGCWWGQLAHCTFCGLNGETMAYRSMPPDMARELIYDLTGRYGDVVKRFNSVDSIMPKEYFNELFGDLKVQRGIEIFYETKADLSDEQVGILSRAGVTRIQPGIESLLTSTLKLMRKGTTAFHNLKLLMSCLNHGVALDWNLLVGFPGETDETFDIYCDLVPKLHHLPPPSGVFPVRFDRFSPYHMDPEKYGIELTAANSYQYCYPFPKDIIERIAYYFQNINIDSTYYEPLAVGLRPVEQSVARWLQLWEDSAGPPPRLELRPDGDRTLLIDSRSGLESTRHLSSAELNILHMFSETAEVRLVEEQDRPLFDALLAEGLLFHERGRALALVPGLRTSARVLRQTPVAV